MTRRQAIAEVLQLLDCSRSTSPVLSRTATLLRQVADTRQTAPIRDVVAALELALPDDREACAAALLLRDQLPAASANTVAKLKQQVQRKIGQAAG